MAARRPLVYVGGRIRQIPAGESIDTGTLLGLVSVQATAVGQTAFTIPNGYTPGAILVWLNGALLNADDFTASTGTTVTLSVGTTNAADILTVLRLTASTTTSPAMTGATSTSSGQSGLVPQPGGGQHLSFLRGDGTWAGVDSGGAGRNLLINPRFTVNQRKYVSGAATTAAGQYTYDRWKVVTSGQAIALAGTVATFPAGGGAQVVEGSAISTGTHTLSWTGTGTATVDGTAVANGGQVSLTNGTNCTVVFVGQVADPKLEFGSSKTKFEARSYAEEELLCFRYYWRINASSANEDAGMQGFMFSASAGHVTGRFPVPMRAPPAVGALDVGFYPPTGGAASASTNFVGTLGSAYTFSANVTMGTGSWTAGQVAFLSMRTANSSYVYADAEL